MRKPKLDFSKYKKKTEKAKNDSQSWANIEILRKLGEY